jgi:hypothetical protein
MLAALGSDPSFKRMNHSICIITSVDGIYGTGHLQRMVYLLQSLRKNGVSVSFLCPEKCITLIPFLNEFIVTSVPPSTDLIIRDMRDSTATEIEILREKAPVIVIDDCGEGRRYADLAIDCLPNLKYPDSVKTIGESPFLFGFSFFDFFAGSDPQIYAKDIDLCIYIGSQPEKSQLESLLSNIPDNLTVCITGSGNPYIVIKPCSDPIPQTFPEVLLRSKAILTHFGISLFEASLCGCALYTINPTQYHSSLCEISKEVLTITNFGLFSELSNKKIKKDLNTEALQLNKVINTEDIRNTIERCTQRFIEKLKPFLE